ncbi:MAG: hypothetical protein NTV86_22630 [Planctomycetota bacterium]|nr:hypothetical protein [Planctomycetota bacterium]
MKSHVIGTLVAMAAAGLLAAGCQKKPESQPASQPAARQPVAGEPAPAAAGGLVPVEISLPAPLFEGTPKPVDDPQIEKPLGKRRPPFLAPPGTVNLALGRAVTSSDSAPVIGDLEQITDGKKEGTDGGFVELGGGKQWVQIDLGSPCTIYAVAVWHYHKQARAYRRVVVQIAADQDMLSNIRTIYNSDRDNTLGLGVGKDKDYVDTHEGRLMDAGGATGQFVRLYSNGNTANDANHYIEVEVYGKRAP